MAERDHFDVVIIGSGAGGGTLAWKLAPSGRRILLLERGPYLPRERDNWQSSAVFVRAKYSTTEEWVDGDGNQFSPEQNYYAGGNTKFYGAALFRLRPEDFGLITHYYGGLSPAWPQPYPDPSFFVSIGAVNPTLTVIANSLRVGEHLLARLA
jgi:choline dehydrogenase-like flavoprotein